MKRTYCKKRKHTLSDHLWEHVDEWDAKFRGPHDPALTIPRDQEKAVYVEWRGSMTWTDGDEMFISNTAAQDLSPLLVVPESRFPNWTMD